MHKHLNKFTVEWKKKLILKKKVMKSDWLLTPLPYLNSYTNKQVQLHYITAAAAVAHTDT